MVQVKLPGVDAAPANDVEPAAVELDAGDVDEGDDGPATERETAPWGKTAAE